MSGFPVALIIHGRRQSQNVAGLSIQPGINPALSQEKPKERKPPLKIVSPRSGASGSAINGPESLRLKQGDWNS